MLWGWLGAMLHIPWNHPHYFLIAQKQKSPTFVRLCCGLDGTRTRDLRRDRAAF